MADRYWVGGTGSWSSASTTNWSDTSGGAGGFSVPTAADNVFFDVNSNTGADAFTVTMVTTPRVCNDFTASGLDGVMTLAGSSIGLTVSGSLTFQATNFSRTYTGTTTFAATTTGKTVTTNGVSFGSVTFDGVGGGWTLGSALTATGTLTITNGTFDTSSSGNYSVSASIFSSSNSNIRTINLNASTITLSTTGTAWSMATSTNATVNAGTSTINITGSTSPGFAGGSRTYRNVAFTATTLTTPSITGTNTFNNLTITGRTTVGHAQLSLSANQTINGTFTVSAGTASAYRTQIFSSTLGTARTLTCAAIATMSDVDFRDITIAGAHGTLSGTRLGDCKGNSGITFDAAKTVYYGQTGSANWGATGSGSWSATSGGALDATQFPLAQDTAVFPAATYPASGSTTTINDRYNIGTIDMSLRTTNTMTLATSSNSPVVFGNWTNGTGITISGTGTIYFAGRITQQITSAAKSFTQTIEISSPSGTVQLQDAFTTSSSLSFFYGTLNLNGYVFSMSSFTMGGTNGPANINASTAGSAIYLTSLTGGWTANGTGSLTGVLPIYLTATPTTGNRDIRNTTFDNSSNVNNRTDFYITGGSGAATISFGVSGGQQGSIDFTGFSGTCNLGTTSGGSSCFIQCYGHFILSAGMSTGTYGTNGNLFFYGFASGATTALITTNAKSITRSHSFGRSNNLSATMRLTDNFTADILATTTFSAATLDLQSYTLSTGLFSSSTSTTRTIAFGTGNITCTGTGTVWNTSTTTNLTVTGTPVVNVTSVGSTAINVYAGQPSEANSISFNFTGGTYALLFGYLTGTPAVRNLNFTGYAGTFTIDVGANTVVYGNLTVSSGMTVASSTATMTFGATSGTKTITTNAKTIDFPLTFNGVGGTFQLQDALTMGSSRTGTLTNGTLDLNGFTYTVGTAFTTATGTKNLTFNGGTLVCPTAAATAFNNASPTGFTTTAGTGTGTISMTAATAKTFVGGGSTFNCTLNQGGAGALTVTGSNTFNNITNTYKITGATSILFTAATTSTFTDWNASGESTRLLTIGSVTAASHTLSKSSGTVSADFLSVSQSTATGGAAWYAGANSTNGGNNSGWIFTAPPIVVVIGAGIIIGTGIVLG